MNVNRDLDDGPVLVVIGLAIAMVMAIAIFF